jgi:hypothetical protein
MYSTAVGLVLMGLKSHSSTPGTKKSGGASSGGGGIFQDILGRMKNWFGDSI